MLENGWRTSKSAIGMFKASDGWILCGYLFTIPRSIRLGLQAELAYYDKGYGAMEIIYEKCNHPLYDSYSILR